MSLYNLHAYVQFKCVVVIQILLNLQWVYVTSKSKLKIL